MFSGGVSLLSRSGWDRLRRSNIQINIREVSRALGNKNVAQKALSKIKYIKTEQNKKKQSIFIYGEQTKQSQTKQSRTKQSQIAKYSLTKQSQLNRQNSPRQNSPN